ncbi:helix-turn-helix transcriptional regulator [Longimycelium tulufanense]|uniref:Helix-turn-helix transcriptional regulator n=1 Tax=Longimycelium tulufanense TaxID=907463 RepID=A0A8J3C9L4_9PSEU|nr:response regulator transcription factor [Longimycelium tulufanense]GGM46189.1 helix-turn-helix transcriptional regulator [Longimycelium tulufanense]
MTAVPVTRPSPQFRVAKGLRPSAGLLSVLAVSALPLMREGIARVVERTPRLFLAGSADTGAAAVNLVHLHRPDVVVLDELVDPRFDLLHLFTAEAGCRGAVLLCRTEQQALERAGAARRAGATAVLPASAAPGLLARAVRHAGGEPLLPEKPAAATASHSEPATARRATPLSRRESQVLQLIAEGLDNRTIAELLVLSVETVRTHAKNLARKLGARDRGQVIAIAYRSGMVHPGGAGAFPRRP